MDGHHAGPPSERTKVRRLPERAAYERERIEAVLDEGFVCHLGFAGRDGRQVVIPTTYGRDGDTVYVHGSPAAGMVRSLRGGLDASLAVTLVDGLVLARSAFHHSMNYRSVVLVGRGERVDDPDEKRAAFDAIVDHVVPGRSQVARPASGSELRATFVLRLPIDEGSVKVRGHGAGDDDDDLDLAVWAGVVPTRLVADDPIQEPDQRVSDLAPPVAAAFDRGHGPT